MRFAALVVLVAFPARAYRPFDGTDASVAEHGELEIELGPVGYLRNGSERFLVTPAVIVNLGVLDRTELVVQSSHHLLLGASGQSARSSLVDNSISLKRVLREGELQDASGPSIAAEVGLLVPASQGDPGIGDSAAVIVSRKTRWAALHLNAAVSVRRGQNAVLFGSAIVEGPDEWPVRPVSEVFVQPELGVDTGISGLIGAIWRVSKPVSFDAGLRVAREAGQGVVEARVGLTFGLSLFP